jgi:uncharacterized protein YjbI with pentapeptide repeats
MPDAGPGKKGTADARLRLIVGAASRPRNLNSHSSASGTVRNMLMATAPRREVFLLAKPAALGITPAKVHGEDPVVAEDAKDEYEPDWEPCGWLRGRRGKRCLAVPAAGFRRCLAHLNLAKLEEALATLEPGSGLDARGTTISADLLARIVRAVQGNGDHPIFGPVWFERAHFGAGPEYGDLLPSRIPLGFTGAEFLGEAWFSHAKFSGEAQFLGAQFRGIARFGGAEFGKHAWFGGVKFSSDAWFNDAECLGGTAGFNEAEFRKDAIFLDAEFLYIDCKNTRFAQSANFNFATISTANFRRTQFGGSTAFLGTLILKDAQFYNAKFETTTQFGPLAVGKLILSGALFGQRVVIEAAANNLECRKTTWHRGATLRLRYADIDLEHATFTVPSSVAGSDQVFAVLPGSFGEISRRKHLWEDPIKERFEKERGKSAAPSVPVVTSLQGTDAANLSLIDIDLSRCRFAGARLLDQVRLEGRCVFDRPAKGIRAGLAWPPVWRWSSRQTLAEERTWRATTRKHAGWVTTKSDKKPPDVGPERLAGLYRQLRKAQEDAKNEPGAADFYYGEMEMRRHAATTPAAERTIVWLYWLISGYGLRALRSLAALAVLGVVITATLTGFGLAATALVTAPPQHLAGTVTTAPHKPARITATLQGIAPGLPAANQRWTSERTRTALEVTLESLVFRSTDQPLTTAGVWITVAARILGPVLLALTLLAARNRVKR